MQKRAVRLVLLAVLLVGGAGAGLVIWNADTQSRAIDATGRDAATRIDRLLTVVADVAAAQPAYVAPGQPSQPSLERVASGIQQIYSDLSTIRSSLRSPDASGILTTLERAAGSLVDADSSARGHLRSGQTLWASEVVFGQARDTLAAMTKDLRALREAEQAASGAARTALARQVWTVLGATAALWAVGLALLARLPLPAVASTALAAPTETSTETTSAAPPAPVPAGPDLAAAADVCVALSRLTSVEALPTLLAGAAGALDAAGVIVWMGAGDELFAAVSHGYDPRMVGRMGPIHRSAENATAIAWRTGELRAVDGDPKGNGAIVAPMFGPDGCIGVLAAEVRHGREADPGVRSIAAMIAAQLATVVAAWPASSSPVEPAAPEALPLQEASGL